MLLFLQFEYQLGTGLTPSKHAYMGPIWAAHMGSATGFRMGPILVIPYADCPDGSHMRVWMGGGSGIHYSLRIKPIIHLIKILGYSLK